MEDLQPTEEAVSIMTKRLLLETEEFSQFYKNEVAKLQEAANEKDYKTMYERKKAMCYGLSEARRRLLELFDPVDELMDSPISSMNEKDIVNLLRKDNQKLLQARGIEKRSPIVYLLGFHGNEKAELREMVLKMGAAYSAVCSRNTVTHVVANESSLISDKALTIQSWGITLLSKLWLDACIASSMIVDHGPFERQAGDPVKFETATPSCDLLYKTPASARQPTQQQQRSNFGSGEFLLAVEKLCEATTTQFGVDEVTLTDTQQQQQQQLPDLVAEKRPRRVSRQQLLQEPTNVVKRKRKSGIEGGTANTVAEVEGKDQTSTAERLPLMPDFPPPQPVSTTGGPATAGVESQCVRWDDALSGRTEEQLKARINKRTFQIAGGGGVTKAGRDSLVALIKQLGGEVELVPKYISRATHLVNLSETTQLTEKYLSFVASGKWIVRESYIRSSSEAGRWLDEEDYSNDGPERTIAFHRGNNGGAFKHWKVALMMKPCGIYVILRAGGCTELYSEINNDNINEITHILTDTQNSELTLPTPTGPCVTPDVLKRLSHSTFSVEILYRLLCISSDEKTAQAQCALALKWV
eukprot:TRINITY_DN3058_c0_g1_i4.p1 TRINITY_DN3058_c0_g1~~TRINITY_DN3058_c0_g1_i4.p1  ORF type:complete len:583 (+),score=133.46 TRINITY_DN3058_c0_g1_i4:1907-3655(+)